MAKTALLVGGTAATGGPIANEIVKRVTFPSRSRAKARAFCRHEAPVHDLA